MTTIRVVDFETTGMEPPAEVIEVGFCDLTGDGGGWVVGTPTSRLCRVTSNPPEARAVHHISTAEAADSPRYDHACLPAGFDAIAAHMLEFEAKWLPPLVEREIRLCTYKAALRLWPDAP